MKRIILYIILGVLLLAMWEYFGRNYQTVRLLMSSPSLSFKYFIDNGSELMLATYTTLIEAVAGLALAVIFSFLIMIVCFFRPKFMEFVLPIMITSQVVPIIVLTPFFIILFGIGIGSKVAMAAVISFFPVFVNFAQGYKSISTNIHELMLINNAPLIFRIRRVYFPLSMPSIIAGLKISATLAVIGAIVAEFSGAQVGLGRNLFISALRLEPEMMVTSLVLSALLGLFLFGMIKIIENRMNWL